MTGSAVQGATATSVLVGMTHASTRWKMRPALLVRRADRPVEAPVLMQGWTPQTPEPELLIVRQTKSLLEWNRPWRNEDDIAVLEGGGKGRCRS